MEDVGSRTGDFQSGEEQKRSGAARLQLKALQGVRLGASCCTHPRIPKGAVQFPPYIREGRARRTLLRAGTSATGTWDLLGGFAGRVDEVADGDGRPGVRAGATRLYRGAAPICPAARSGRPHLRLPARVPRHRTL